MALRTCSEEREEDLYSVEARRLYDSRSAASIAKADIVRNYDLHTIKNRFRRHHGYRVSPISSSLGRPLPPPRVIYLFFVSKTNLSRKRPKLRVKDLFYEPLVSTPF
jgi:hypothetical protein